MANDDIGVVAAVLADVVDAAAVEAVSAAVGEVDTVAQSAVAVLVDGIFPAVEPAAAASVGDGRANVVVDVVVVVVVVAAAVVVVV